MFEEKDFTTIQKNEQLTVKNAKCVFEYKCCTHIMLGVKTSPYGYEVLHMCEYFGGTGHRHCTIANSVAFITGKK